jgi:hypothetical protein
MVKFIVKPPGKMRMLFPAGISKENGEPDVEVNTSFPEE